MATDDERREVARRLRELASDADEVSDFDLAKTLELGAVSRYGYDPRDVERLADLIEPSCDREALLALARWFDARATDLLKKNSIDHSRRRTSARRGHAMDLMTACGLIREACGEAVS